MVFTFSAPTVVPSGISMVTEARDSSSAVWPCHVTRVAVAPQDRGVVAVLVRLGGPALHVERVRLDRQDERDRQRRGEENRRGACEVFPRKCECDLHV